MSAPRGRPRLHTYTADVDATTLEEEREAIRTSLEEYDGSQSLMIEADVGLGKTYTAIRTLAARHDRIVFAFPDREPRRPFRRQ